MTAQTKTKTDESALDLNGPIRALAIRTALTLRAVFRLALRQTEGLIGSILHLLGLDLAVPDHSILSRRAETLELPRPCSSSREPVRLLVGLAPHLILLANCMLPLHSQPES
jgi:hypothetical protein